MPSASYILFLSVKKAYSGIQRGFLYGMAAIVLSLLSVPANAKTHVFNGPILASNNPFSACSIGTDTIIIRNTFSIDVNYEPIIGGIPYEGLLIVDGGLIDWTSNAYLKLGYPARVILINGGLLKPGSSNSPDCSGLKALYFDTKKTVNCNGIGAPHAFSDVNMAGCVTEIGICCNAFIIETDSSGTVNDLTLCQPGDTAHLSVAGSGQLGYTYLWTPNIGPAGGIYPVAPVNNTNYSVNLTAIFDPYGPEPPYLLTCGGTVTVKINPHINLSASATAVPCASVASGSIDLSVSGGTSPYKYKWSSGQTTQDLNNVPGGTYTVTVTDAKGCAEVLTKAVPVQDNTPPTITCPGNAAGIANPGVCTTLIPNINAVFSDNCPTVGVTYALAGATTGAGSGQLSNTVPFSSGNTTVTYTVDDGSNMVSCSFVVTVQDNQLPTASNPAPLSGSLCLSAVPAPNPAVVTNEADNCGTPLVTFLSDNIAGGGGCPGDTLIVLRKYKVSDAAGNSVVVTQTIRVVDNQAPAFISVPGNITVECQSIPVVGSPSATDNCSSNPTVSYAGETRNNGTCADTYTLTRRWTATDNCGNSVSATQLITVRDQTKPAFTAVPANITVSCDALPAVGAPVASDNCDATVSITYDGQTRTDGACPDSYTLTRRWTATDNCGNTQSTQQTIVVQDLTKPAFTAVPANVTVNCQAIPAVGTPSASDNCDAAVAIVYNGETRTDGACADTYSLTRRWTATDNCGNSTSAVQVIAVQDVTQPVFTVLPPNTTVSCDAVPAVGTATASDNCDASVAVNFINEVRTNGACPDGYTLTRRWMATDNCGNTAIGSQVITVQDQTKPVFTAVPANVTLSCETIPSVGTPTASDNCDAAVSIAYTGETRTDGACPDTYTLTRIWRATDNCGNSSTTAQVITIRDLTAPVFTAVPPALTVSCDAIPPVGSASATDNCDATVSISYSGETRTNGACTDNYTLTRRWVATDNCGNTKSAEQTITVRDQTSPVFTFVPANAVVDCEAIPSIASPTATDNCDASVLITFAGVTQSSGNCTSGGTVIRRWIAADNCGNTATAEQMLMVQDTTKPAFLFVPANITTSCDAIPAPGSPTASDNCTSTVDITFNGETRTDGSCPDTYTLLRRWTATDICGNTVSAQQLITVQDLVPPVFTNPPANLIVSCDAVPAVNSPVATDNCDAAVTVLFDGETRINGACPDTYGLLRHWTATDNCGNSVTWQQTITVRDLNSPVFTATPADVTVNCETIPAVGTPVASDNCDASLTITYAGETRTDGFCPNTYTLLRRWSATDNCGNSTATQQTITVQDISAPVFTSAPADATVSCENIPTPGAPTVTDNCTVGITLVYDGEVRTNGACPDTYTLVRRWTATDQCGNTATAEQTIQVEDLVAPVFSFIPENDTISCAEVPLVGQPVATDNCAASAAILFVGETRVDGNCPDSYSLLRQWTATDNCGNVATATQTLVVQDIESPVFTFIPANVTMECDAVPALETPTASDNCTTAPSITFDGETRTDGPCDNAYLLVRRWTAADHCGNTTSAVQMITIVDNTAPKFTSVPAPVTVNCDVIPPVGTPVATDNCDASVTVTYLGEFHDDGNCPNNYVLRRQWSALDNCGNLTTAEQMVTVQDTTRPVLALVPANAVVSCESIPAVGNPIASDNCTTLVPVMYEGETRVDGACPDTYTLFRHWTATDNCGNSVAREQKITVQDVQQPAFTFVPANVTVSCEQVPTLDTPAATDNCDQAVAITFDGETRSDGACPDTYTLLRRWTATDNCGNSVQAEQSILVQDTTIPVFTFVPADATVNCEDIPGLGVPAATDNCDAAVTIIFDGELFTGGNCASGGMVLRRWTAVDNCGNSTTAVQMLTVQDVTKPVFTYIPSPVTVECDAVPSVDTPTATDNCTAQVAITYEGESRVDGACPDTYVLTRRWVAADICGNSDLVEQKITVNDTATPQFTFVPADATVECQLVPALGQPVATDNCDADVTIVFNGETRTDGLCADSYLLQRRWTATDNCGNSVTTQQFITVRDLTAPVFTFTPASLTTSCAAIPSVGVPVANDNCDATVTIIYAGETRTNGNCPDSYTLTRRWTAADNCGNVVSTEQIISVLDNTPPQFTSVPADATVSCESVPAFQSPVATDNCATNVTVAFDGETRTDGFCLDTYLLTRRWTATDNCGNTVSTQQLITVRDITPPVFISKPANITVSCESVPAPETPVATDNCDASISLVYLGESVVSSNSPTTYLMKRRWTATDNCGNSMLAEQFISVQDLVVPTIICPPSVSVDANAATCNTPATFEAPFTSDNCSDDVLITASAVSGDVFPIGTTTIVLTAKDESGNTSTCTFTVLVADTTLPVMTNCPANITVTTPDNGCEAKVNWTAPTVIDPCDTYAIVPVPTVAPGSMFATGHTTVEYLAQDSSGNTVACSFVVTVDEKVPPVLSNCPTDILLFTDNCKAVADWTPPVATDNCLLDTLISNIQPGTSFAEGKTVVTYSTSDMWGNTAECSFTVTVKDIVQPQFSGCPSDTVVNAAGACSIAVNWDLPTAIDNCTAAPHVFATPMPGADYPVGYTLVKVFVEDPSGNQDTCQFKITVIGPPLGFAAVPADQAFIGCSATATWTPPAPTGVCGPVDVVSNFQPGDTFPVGTTVVEYTVTDTLGNSAQTSFSIAVTESIAPQFDCPASPVLVNISGAILSDPDKFLLLTDTVSGCDGVELSFNLPSATDNCSAPLVEQLAGPATGTFFAIGTQVLSFKTTDAAGNTAMCMVDIEVSALQPLDPQISDKIGCAGDDITLSSPVIPGAVYIWDGPEAPYPNTNTLLIENLAPKKTGIYTVQANWNGCLTPLDSALVRQAVLPDAIDDLDYQVETSTLLDNIDVTLNDFLEYDDYKVTLLTELEGLTETGNGTFSYQAGPQNGRVNFLYKLCSEACPDLCDEAAVTITIRETFCSYIPNVITPNNDGINDYLEIPCLETELYPNNSLIIYNQWGDKVFQASPYLNDPLHAWQGTLDGRAGQALPDGTYFYFFQPDPEKSAMSGFIEVFR